MDKTENRKEKVNETIEQKSMGVLEIPVGLEYTKDLEDFLKRIDASRDRAVTQIRKDAKSFFSNKKTLLYILNLVDLSHEMAKIGITTAYGIEVINRKLSLLEQAVVILASKKQKSEKTLSSENMKEQKNVAKQQRELEEILSKMDIQKQKETLEAFQRLDKIREDLLRVDIV